MTRFDERWEKVYRFPAYEVSSKGRIRNARTKKDKAVTLRGGKLWVSLMRQGLISRKPVERLVARAFLGPARKRRIIHADGDPLNSRVANLKYRDRL